MAIFVSDQWEHFPGFYKAATPHLDKQISLSSMAASVCDLDCNKFVKGKQDQLFQIPCLTSLNLLLIVQDRTRPTTATSPSPRVRCRAGEAVRPTSTDEDALERC